MPQTVELPDGVIVEFPDGMSEAKMKALLDRDFGTKKPEPFAVHLFGQPEGPMLGPTSPLTELASPFAAPPQPPDIGGALDQAGIGITHGGAATGAQGNKALEMLTRAYLSFNPRDKLGNVLAEQFRGASEVAQQASEEQEQLGRETPGPAFVRELASTATQLAPSLAAAPLGFPAMVGAAGVQSMAGTQIEAEKAYQKQGMTPEKAYHEALKPALIGGAVTAAITALFGKTGVESIAGDLVKQGGWKEIGKRIGVDAIAEGAEEWWDQVGQGAIAVKSYRPELEWEQAVDEAAKAFALGGVMGGAMRAVGEASARPEDTTTTGETGKEAQKGFLPVDRPVIDREPTVYDEGKRIRIEVPPNVPTSNVPPEPPANPGEAAVTNLEAAARELREALTRQQVAPRKEATDETTAETTVPAAPVAPEGGAGAGQPQGTAPVVASPGEVAEAAPELTKPVETKPVKAAVNPTGLSFDAYSQAADPALPHYKPAVRQKRLEALRTEWERANPQGEATAELMTPEELLALTPEEQKAFVVANVPPRKNRVAQGQETPHETYLRFRSALTPRMAATAKRSAESESAFRKRDRESEREAREAAQQRAVGIMADVLPQAATEGRKEIPAVTKERPALGATAKEVWQAWKAAPLYPMEVNIAHVMGEGDFQWNAQGQLEKVEAQKTRSGVISTVRPATQQEEDAVFEGIENGTVQIERQRITGAGGGWSPVAAGSTIKVLHQSTGKPLDPEKRAKMEAEAQKRVQELTPAQPTARTEGEEILSPEEQADAQALLDAEQNEDIVARLEKLKKPLEPGVGANPIGNISRAVWNTGIDVAIGLVKAGRTLADAIDAAIAYMKANTPDVGATDAELRGAIFSTETAERFEQEASEERARLESAEEKLADIVNTETRGNGIGVTPVASQRPTDVVQGDLKSVSPQVEARWQAAVRQRESIFSRLATTVEKAWHSVTREYAGLDPRKYALPIDILRRLRASRNANARRTVDVLRGITSNLGPKQYSVFNRVVVLEDLLKDVNNGMYAGEKAIPFGYVSAAELRADLDKFRSIAEATPQIADALQRRREFMDALRDTLVEKGILPDSVKEDPRYFHHQVLLYMAGRNATGGPKSFRGWRSGWQRSRTGSSQDYNRQYIEAEAAMIADAFNKLTMQQLQAEMKAAVDLQPQLKKLHGKDWEQYIPETHTRWQPKRGNLFYPVQTVAEKAMEEYLEGVRFLMPEDFKEKLALGPKRTEWIIPKDLAPVLDKLKAPEDVWVFRMAESVNTAWKRYILLNPLRAAKYMLNNMTGDLDFLFAAEPGIFAEFKQAAVDMYRFHKRKGAAAGDVKDAMEGGVIGSGWRASELPDVADSDFFYWLTNEKPGMVKRYWDWIGRWNDTREDTGRLAAYRYALKQWNAGTPFYGASVPADVDTLKTNKDKAAKVARELLIDYGRETEFGEFTRRKVMPFYRWMHGNFARYIQLMRNVSQGKASVGVLPRMAFAYLVINLWNHLMFPDEEDELGEGRNQLHLIVGRDGHGRIQSIRFQGALSDLLGWVGLENLPQDVQDVWSGKATMGDKMEEARDAAISKAVNASLPFQKTAAEVLMQRSLYPNALEPRPIRDRAEHAAGLFSLSNVYRWLARKPHGTLRDEVAALLVYSTDPGEAAYNTTRHIAAEWLEDQGVERPQIIPSKRSNALYYYKQAKRRNDDKLAAKFLAEYKRLGGTDKGMKQSITLSHPLASLGKRNKQFMDGLTPGERATVQRAVEWYERVYR